MSRFEVQPIPPFAQDIDPEIAQKKEPAYYAVIEKVIGGERSCQRLSLDGKEIVRHVARSVLDSLYDQLHRENTTFSWTDINIPSLKDKLTGAARYKKQEDRPLNEMRSFLADIDNVSPGSASSTLVTVISESVAMLQGRMSTYETFRGKTQRGSLMGTAPGAQRHSKKPGIGDSRY